MLVHDAARPNLRGEDIGRLIAAAEAAPDGAILGAPLRHAQARRPRPHRRHRAARGPVARVHPQAFRRGALTATLAEAARAGVAVTDEASAMERSGVQPWLVEGREDNLKVTTPADLALAEYLIGRH
nr:2-C-methyl-D-erythritol 4-phosphate cytidylyltransferase [Lysobacter enzymogenes]